MKAWRMVEPMQMSFNEMESQPVGENCVKVKMLYCSISATDRLIYLGKLKAEYPIILGRHGVGMVVEVGEQVKSLARGNLVAIKPMSPCGNCSKCSDNQENECENMLTFGINEDGFLRDFVVINCADAVKLPERVSAKEATFIDQIEMAIETIDRLKIEKGKYLVIAGATELGIILAQTAMYYQIVPILVDINEAYLNLASQMGVYYTINSSELDTKKRIFSLTGGKMADAVAFITDSIYPFNPISDFVKRGGEIAIIGLRNSKSDLSGSFTPILNRALSIYGISESNRTASAINMLANKGISTAELIREEIPLENIEAEFKKEFDSDSLYLKTLVKI